MRITKNRLKEIIKEEIEAVKEGPQRAFCVGYEKDGETKHQTVHADAAGFAERKIKKEHDKATHCALCDKQFTSIVQLTEVRALFSSKKVVCNFVSYLFYVNIDPFPLSFT